jgi:peroxiredoxin
MRVFSLLLLFSLGPGLLGAGEAVGRRAPGFSLPDRTFKYQDPLDYRGRILVVEFMQTTCPHCAEFSKILQEAGTKYGGKVAVLSIVNPPDTLDKVNAYVAAHKLTFPILFDTGQVAFSFLQWKPGQTAGMNIPRVFVIDPNGIIRLDLEYSVMTKEVFEGRGLFAELDKLLAQSPAGAKK